MPITLRKKELKQNSTAFFFMTNKICRNYLVYLHDSFTRFTTLHAEVQIK